MTKNTIKQHKDGFNYYSNGIKENSHYTDNLIYEFCLDYVEELINNNIYNIHISEDVHNSCMDHHRNFLPQSINDLEFKYDCPDNTIPVFFSGVAAAITSALVGYGIFDFSKRFYNKFSLAKKSKQDNIEQGEIEEINLDESTTRTTNKISITNTKSYKDYSTTTVKIEQNQPTTSKISISNNKTTVEIEQNQPTTSKACSDDDINYANSDDDINYANSDDDYGFIRGVPIEPDSDNHSIVDDGL